MNSIQKSGRATSREIHSWNALGVLAAGSARADIADLLTNRSSQVNRWSAVDPVRRFAECATWKSSCWGAEWHVTANHLSWTEGEAGYRIDYECDRDCES